MKEIIEKLRALPIPLTVESESQAYDFIRFLANHEIIEEDFPPISRETLTDDTSRMIAVFKFVKPSYNGINYSLYKQAEKKVFKFEQLYLNYLRSPGIAVTGPAGTALAAGLLAGLDLHQEPDQANSGPSPTARR